MTIDTPAPDQDPTMLQPLKYARVERERRFLLSDLPAGVATGEFVHFDDLYITGTSLRLRRRTARAGEPIEYKLTQKIDRDPAHRIITTIYLDADEFARFEVLPGARLSKRRHRLSWRDTTYGIDEFEGALTGLVLAEIEFEDDAALVASGVPAFACCEVTDRLEFTGGALASGDPRQTMRLIDSLLRTRRRPA